MKHLLAILAFSITVALAIAPTSADEPHLSFLQKLRDRREADLALKYLTEVLSVDPPPELKAILPLEMAKTRLALAGLKSTAAERTAEYQQARNELEAFIKANKDHPLAAAANLDIARIMALEGRAQLNVAERERNEEKMKAEAEKALKLFADAAPRLENAGKQIQAQLDKLPEAKTPQDRLTRDTLTQNKLEAEFEQAMNLRYQSRAYETLGDGEKQAKARQDARDILKSLAARDLKKSICWQARAWVGWTYYDEDKLEEAKKEFDRIVKEPGEHAEVGRRLAHYYLYRMIVKDPAVKTPLVERQNQGELWLKRYPNHLNTPEGLSLRFDLANAYRDSALSIHKDLKKEPPPGARPFYAKAETHYKYVADHENPNQDLARQLWGDIIVRTGTVRAGGDIDKFTKFEDCLRRAQADGALLDEDEKAVRDATLQRQKAVDELPADLPDKEKKAKLEPLDKKLADAKQKRHKRQDDIIRALLKGLSLANAKDSPNDVLEARSKLVFMYAATGDPYRAVMLGEILGHAQPEKQYAAQAAGYALEAYVQIIHKQQVALEEEKKNEANGEKAKRLQEYIAADLDRFYQLAGFIEEKCKDDYVVSATRYMVGMQLIQEGRLPAAVQVLGKVSNQFAYAAEVKYRLAMAARKLEHDENLNGAQKLEYRKKALEALMSMPEVPDNADPQAATFYVHGRTQLLWMWLPDKKYDDIEKGANALEQRLPKLRIADDARTELEAEVSALKFAAKHGQATNLILAGQFAKVRAMTDEAVKEIEGGAAANERYANIRRALVMLNLRANVQEGNLKRAQELLKLLEDNAKKSDNQLSQADVLQDLVREIREQIAQLKKQGDAQKEQLTKLKSRFSDFLDLLAKQPKLQPRNVLFLVDSYSSVENHQKALAMLRDKKFEIPKPDPVPPLDKSLIADETALEQQKQKEKAYQEQLGMHYHTQMLIVRETRLSARGLPQEERDKILAEAKKTVNSLLETKWGKAHIGLRKERVQILEDMELYGGAQGAGQEWHQLIVKLKPPFKEGTRQKEDYFECYYHLPYCYYKNAQKRPNPKKKADDLKEAARKIVALEKSEPTMGGEMLKRSYEDLLQDPELKKYYRNNGGKMFLTATDVAALEEEAKNPPKDEEPEEKKDAKAGAKAQAAPPPGGSKAKWLLFAGLLAVGLGAVCFAFYRWIKT